MYDVRLVFFRAPGLAAPLLLVAPACFIDKGGDASATSTTSTTTDAEVTTTGGAASAGDTSQDPTTGSTLDPTGPGGADCWSQGIQGWPLAGVPLTSLSAEAPRDPFISADGLRLYYVALADKRPFRSSRTDRSMPFPDGAQISQWTDLPDLRGAYLAVVLGEGEMLLTAAGDIYVSTHTPDNLDEYSLPVLLGGDVNTDIAEDRATATADGTLLIVTRNDGPPVAPYPASWRFIQLTRDAPSPGAPFTGDVDVTPLVEPLGLSVCPAVSPDGLHLFFTATEDDAIDTQNPGQFGIFYTRRADRDAAWAPAQKIPGLAGNGAIPCPRSVTSDGCELTYTTFTYDPTKLPGRLLALRAVTD